MELFLIGVICLVLLWLLAKTLVNANKHPASPKDRFQTAIKDDGQDKPQA